ncbi:hypothetical protein [Streptomyces bohaiensis]|uniref:DNA-binding protein n=1 Tax=Streptomyces bohaiensis TaxID=1431344 RepID=A0ABX1C8C2_9ACTN|nr:hypothetical protein [Streptomyces bohaiensis]NJQ14188.1 hypothetical protein [Streptomyces bohaiensis]
MASTLPAGLVPLLTAQQLQEYYGMSDWTMRQLIKGGMPTEPTGTRSLRFDLERVREWMAARPSATAAA